MLDSWLTSHLLRRRFCMSCFVIIRSKMWPLSQCLVIDQETLAYPLCNTLFCLPLCFTLFQLIKQIPDKKFFSWPKYLNQFWILLMWPDRKVSEWVSEWMSEWVGEWVGEWVSEWVSACWTWESHTVANYGKNTQWVLYWHALFQKMFLLFCLC